MPRWVIHRQDESGNELRVETVDSEEEAKRRVAEHVALGHKQKVEAPKALAGGRAA